MNKLIKKMLVIAVLLGFVATASFAASGEKTSPGIGFVPTQGGLKSDPPKTFRLVRYVESSYGALGSLSADNIVVWHTGAVTYDGITVTTTTTSGDTAVAGVLVSAAQTRELGAVNNTAYQDLNNRNWCWIQTYGPAQVYIDDVTGIASCTAGSAFGTGNKSAYASVFTYDTSITNAGKKHGFAGFFLSDAAAHSDVPVFIRTE